LSGQSTPDVYFSRAAWQGSFLGRGFDAGLDDEPPDSRFAFSFNPKSLGSLQQ